MHSTAVESLREPPTPSPADPREAAESAGLVYVTDEDRGIRRERKGDAFEYLRPGGERLRDEASLERIRKLAIPPAWTEVWICNRANGHLQATGRDARGRKQYRYHPQFREVRESTKYEHMLEFAQALPAIRGRLAEHMALRGLPREKVLATVVHLLETTLIRVGNDDYARENRSYGLTTLRNPHVKVEGSELRFQFKGKSGKTWRLQVKDRRIAKIVRACQDLPGQRLFQYLDEQGEVREVTSADVNAYLREVTGSDITAKDFRTWAGTVMAALALRECEAVDTKATQKKNIRQAIERVAERLGNTPTICRKCYVHPEVLNAYVEGNLLLEIGGRVDELAALKPEEAAVLALLQGRLRRTLGDALQDSLAAVKKRKTRRRTAKA
ncbi:DNA topoisomerase IB [Ramlibacter monticola]|uniref:DNA topoisomerase n=1 Tax=Ramlibacter monticola TaxID=1926872 RepID=A0A936Z170_9BURK|nr:DNA topoisomerase IB [Ramlibacter monticola]MBL0393203.1 DNA topoisomerase IB [Ramlibacter monticola]